MKQRQKGTMEIILKKYINISMINFPIKGVYLGNWSK